MSFRVKVDIPTAGDQDVYIDGLGTFRNGGEYTVDDDQVMRYRVINGTHSQGIWDADGKYVGPHDEDGHFETRFELGPEPQDVEMAGVTVTKVEDTGTPPQTQQEIDEEQAKEAGQ